MRSVWKGSISSGLVNIPITDYLATREGKVAFKQFVNRASAPPLQEGGRGRCEKGKWVMLEAKDFEAHPRDTLWF